ncbi:long-chain fatty acid transport protein [Psychrobacter sp. PL15]|uniref:outer membrane protein transport protein n=1 Tax=Psychrobacter sp. PL15 TaxID=3071719 RepID=UPI002E01AC9B|nr:long-chain fatty acid transport protein [Psychrobacter sp. PL15]
MRPTFNFKTLAVAITAISAASVASAAGLDRSGQDITAFLQDGLYAEASYTYIDADVSGKDASGNKIDDIAESYDFFRYGVKADINDTFSVGILYDEPFGAAADYSGDNNFVAQGDRNAVFQDVLANPNITEEFINTTLVPSLLTKLNPGNADDYTSKEIAGAKADYAGIVAATAIADAEEATTGEGTNVEVRSESITAILGMKFGENKNFQVYGGPVAQRIEADVKLRGIAYGPATGYTTHISPEQDYGYLAGISYSKPEIALKAALTYRSEIDHSAQLIESYPVAPTVSRGNLPASQGGIIEITTPKSVNFDFQTGINPTTLVTAKVRYVPWSDFEIVPPLYNDVSKLATDDDKGLALVGYDDDQWLVELGLAKRLSPALAVSGTVGWDSGAGDPTTSLGPIEGYYSVGLGAKYNVTESWAVSAGGKYLWFGDAEGQLPTKKIVGNFEDNDGYIVGMKLSYQAQQKFN